MSSLGSLSWPDLIKDVFSHALGNLMKRRAKEASEILLAALEDGEKQLVDIEEVDEVAAMVFQYAAAAQHGAARRNLELMAQVFHGLLMQSPPLYADEFLRWSHLLEDLTREEIVLLATLHRLEQRPESEREEHRPVATARIELVGANNVFSTVEEFDATATALTRTGFVVLHPGWDGSSHPKTTSRLAKLLKYATLD